MSARRKSRCIRAEFGGFDWIPEVDPTLMQVKLIEFLSRVTRGTHHFHGKVDACGNGVKLTRPNSYELATYDADILTRLVLLAHESHVRVKITGAAPGYLCIYAHQRSPKFEGDCVWERHPGLDELIEMAETLKEVQG